MAVPSAQRRRSVRRRLYSVDWYSKADIAVAMQINRDRLADVQVCIGLGSVVVGLLLVVAPGTQLFSFYEQSITAALGDSAESSATQSTLLHWLLATCGAGVVGWGIAWATIAHIPLRRGDRWAYNCLWISLLAWAALDALIAWWFGVAGELVFVSLAFLAASVPLALGRRGFLRPNDERAPS